MLPSDNEDAMKAAAERFEDDSRVRQFHDPERKAGDTLAENLLYKDAGPAWDVYLFYKKDSRWEDDPPKPADWMHQLAGGERADPKRFRPGPKLVQQIRESAKALLKTDDDE